MTMLLGLFAITCATLLVFFHEPLPWSESYGPMPVLPGFYMVGVWFSIVLAIFFIIGLLLLTRVRVRPVAGP